MLSRRYLAPVLITLLAVYLRLYGLSDFVVNVDHAYPIAQAIGLAQNGDWPFLGQYTSALFDSPPGMAYIVWLPWILFRNTWGVHYCVVLLNVIAVPLLYSCLCRLGYPSQAQGAAFLMAINPWVIQHSQGTWVQGVLVGLSTLTWGGLMLALFGPASRRAAWLTATFVALAILTQTYLLAFLSAVQVGVVALLNRNRLEWRAVALGMSIVAVTTGFYIYQLATHWAPQQAKLESFIQKNSGGALQPVALEHALRYVTGRDYEMIYGNDGSVEWQIRHGVSLAISWGLTALIILGVVRIIWLLLRRRPHAPLWLAVLLWWIIPIVALAVPRQPIHIHYLLLSLPAGFVIVSPVVAPLSSNWWGRSLALLLIGNTLWSLNANSHMLQARPAGGSLDRLSIGATISFQKVAQDLAFEHELSEYYVSWDTASLTARVGKVLHTMDIISLPELEIFPLGRPAVYIRMAQGEPAAPLPLAQRAAQLNYVGGDFVTFDLIPAFSREQISRLPQHRVEWPTDTGLTLVGYDLSQAGYVLTVYWVVDELVEARSGWLYAPYVHLVDAQGKLIANLDGPGLPGYFYRAGDVYLYRMELSAIPAGNYKLELSLFDGVHGGVGATFLPPGGIPLSAYSSSLALP